MRRDKSDCDIEGVSACVSCDVTHECELVTQQGGERRWVTKGRDKEKTTWKHSTWKQRIVTRLPPQGPEITLSSHLVTWKTHHVQAGLSEINTNTQWCFSPNSHMRHTDHPQFDSHTQSHRDCSHKHVCLTHLYTCMRFPNCNIIVRNFISKWFWHIWLRTGELNPGVTLQDWKKQWGSRCAWLFVCCTKVPSDKCSCPHKHTHTDLQWVP